MVGFLWRSKPRHKNDTNAKGCAAVTYLFKINSHAFFLWGHSFLPNDSNYFDVEYTLKHQQRLFLSADYTNIMEGCQTKN